ncbi:uncharacterized protein LOC111717649 [Eurytemora carolleeae]|uniref:uncharacterized protein LOC111717649 n=1 Tax=Eurytemora carolleeae TaxID=1294199 RepID=UPI000C758244|nr:uncharacterized protein LOC111717649 [Eurytemora carolleeae]|eukprot:XP_023348912.1 uncharacterized protein LOC111717649 [Eurytemora affinis]
MCTKNYPYPFYNGSKCCKENLEELYKNVTTGSRGLLTFYSLDCSGSSIDCLSGYECILHTSETPLSALKIEGVEVEGDKIETFFPMGNEECQRRCEYNLECQAWRSYVITSCTLFKGNPVIKKNKAFGSLTAWIGFKSSYVNVPLN